MKIFITGGSGFVGRHLLPLLEQHEVLALSRDAIPQGMSQVFRVLKGDLKDPSSYADELGVFRPDCCIHLAWEGLPDYSFQHCRDNLHASTALLGVLDTVGCRKTFMAGTCWEYTGLTGAVGEGDFGTKLGLFAAHKLALQTIGQSHAQASGSRLLWGRPFFIYGPGQRSGSLIPACYRSLKQGLLPEINNPLAVNDFVYVGDVARAIRYLIEADDTTGIYNIGSGKPLAVWEVVNLVAAELHLEPVYHDLLMSPGSGFWADISKIDKLGWHPEVSLEVGIQSTLESLERAL